jgi:tetratricopeptide (TPR) repeat protein
MRRCLLLLSAVVALAGCERSSSSRTTASVPDEPSPVFRNVAATVSYVGDAACTSCHTNEASAYRQHAMSQSFHRWTPATRVETPLDKPLHNIPTGYDYSVVDSAGHLYQVESLTGPDGRRVHQLARRIDYVMGSGQVARTYFTEENGRFFQLPLTWYREHGWDFSPGYQLNNARFDRVLPDRCVACHASYPRPIPHLEGKFAELRDGIGCERCHGPGALHVAERRGAAPRDSGYDRTIVNPARLPLERRMDVCEQCHVHTAVTVLREGRNDFSYVPSQPLRDQFAFFKVAGGIDLVSHADRLRQSRCFVATRSTSRPLECATCHNPHQPPPDARTRSQPCLSCHSPAALQQQLARSPSRADHTPTSNCVSCHMPRVQEKPVLHGAFTDHWIRVPSATSGRPVARADDGGPIDPYFERDRTGAEAKVYQGMGEVMYATLANDSRVLADGAAALDAALGTDTTRGDARFLLGVAYQSLDLTDLAIPSLERAVRSDSSRPDRLRALADAYERAGRSPADVEHLYQRALAIQPALAWIRADYASFLQAHGRRADAVTNYRSAVAEQPSLAVALFDLGTALLEEGKEPEAAAAFRRALRLDPSLGEALSPLLEVRATAQGVSSVRVLAAPLPSLPVRARDPRAALLTVPTGGSAPHVTFTNVPSRGLLQILEPEGTLVRALPINGAGALEWDLHTEAGHPIPGGLYRARVQGRDASGQPIAPQLFYFGVVRPPSE